MTTELFFQWKKKKMEERDAGLAAQQAERAKNDRMRFLIPACCIQLMKMYLMCTDLHFYVFQWS